MYSDAVCEEPKMVFDGLKGDVEGRGVAIHVDLCPVLHVQGPALKLCCRLPGCAAAQSKDEQ